MDKVSVKVIETNKSFWNSIKLFMTAKVWLLAMTQPLT